MSVPLLAGGLAGGVGLFLLGMWLMTDGLKLAAAPAVTLALFHTVFIVLGVILMWFLAGRLAAFLVRRFRTAEEDEAKPQYLDRTVLAAPALALDALVREVRRTGEIALRGARRVWGMEPSASPAVLAEQALKAAATLQRLNQTAAEAVTPREPHSPPA